MHWPLFSIGTLQLNSSPIIRHKNINSEKNTTTASNEYLLLITNRKSYVSKSVTLNDLEWPWTALFCVISANLGSFRAHCVKVHVRYLISWWVLVVKRSESALLFCCAETGHVNVGYFVFCCLQCVCRRERPLLLVAIVWAMRTFQERVRYRPYRTTMLRTVSMSEHNKLWRFFWASRFFMVALCNRETIYIFILFLSFFLFFPRLISAVGDWMFTILWHMVWP